MKKVMVLMGGMSSERDISLLSGTNVARALKDAGYAVVTYDLTANLADFIQTLRQEKPDVVFNALHGKYGEDGCIQGLLDMMSVPYTHSGVLASSIGMNKAMARHLVQQIGISVAKGGLMTRQEFIADEPAMPYVIKPNDNGSSVGVTIVRNEADRDEVLSRWPDEQQLLVEAYIPGKELSVAVLDGKALGVVEIVPKTGYYDFQNKYTTGGAAHIIPAPIDQNIYAQAMKYAEQVHHLIGARGVTRSDFRLDDTNTKSPRLVFLEINTGPGMTALSLVPDIAKTCCGLTYEELVSHLVEEATCDT